MTSKMEQYGRIHPIHSQRNPPGKSDFRGFIRYLEVLEHTPRACLRHRNRIFHSKPKMSGSIHIGTFTIPHKWHIFVNRLWTELHKSTINIWLLSCHVVGDKLGSLGGPHFRNILVVSPTSDESLRVMVMFRNPEPWAMSIQPSPHLWQCMRP